MPEISILGARHLITRNILVLGPVLRGMRLNSEINFLAMLTFKGIFLTFMTYNINKISSLAIPCGLIVGATVAKTTGWFLSQNGSNTGRNTGLFNHLNYNRKKDLRLRQIIERQQNL